MTDFSKACLEAHNKYRAKHGAPPLKWSIELEDAAQNWADNLGETGQFAHASNQQRKGAGENIYMCMGKSEVEPSEAVDAWYSEIKDYDFDNDRFSGATGHFTQVVWKSTKELGMGTCKADNGNYFIVARYKPAGNFMSKFAENISPPS